jgi:hypothetical protein
MSLFISFAVENRNGRELETLGSTEHVLVLRISYSSLGTVLREVIEQSLKGGARSDVSVGQPSKAHGSVVTVEVRVVTLRVEHEMSGTSLRFLMTTA